MSLYKRIKGHPFLKCDQCGKFVSCNKIGQPSPGVLITNFYDVADAKTKSIYLCGKCSENRKNENTARHWLEKGLRFVSMVGN